MSSIKYHVSKKQYVKYAICVVFFALVVVLTIAGILFSGDEGAPVKTPETWQIILLVGIFLLIAIVGLLFAWMSLRKHKFYDSKDGFVIEKGLFFKHVITIPYERINTIGVKRNLIDIMLKMTTIQVDTGTTASLLPEANIPLSSTYAKELKFFLENKKNDLSLVLNGPDTQILRVDVEMDVLYKARTGDLFLMGLLKPGVLVSVSMIFLTFVTVFLMGYHYGETTYDGLVPIDLAAFISPLIVSVTTVLVMMLYTWLKYYGYTVCINGEYLEYRYGCFSKTEFRVHKNKINALHLKQSLGYQVFKYVALEASIIGIGESNDNNNQNVESKYLMPIARKQQVEDLIRWLGYDMLEKETFIKPKKLKKFNFFWLPFMFVTAAFIPIPVIFYEHIAKLWVLFVLYIMVYLWIIVYLVLSMNLHAYDITDTFFVVRKGAFTKVLSVTKKTRIQQISYKQHPIHLLERLGHVVLVYKGFAGNIVIRNYDEATFKDIKDKFL